MHTIEIILYSNYSLSQFDSDQWLNPIANYSTVNEKNSILIKCSVFCWIFLVAERTQLNADHWLHKGLISVSFNTKPFHLLKFDSAINVDISFKLMFSVAHTHGSFILHVSSRESNITRKELSKKLLCDLFYRRDVWKSRLKCL